MLVGLGTKLGPYEITSWLGAGGMGEVYRARDTRLGRTVAIKVLPQRLSQTPDLQRRLNHEARAISKLSHPNICALHDIGHHEGTDFLVFEYLEGKTLRQILASGTLSVQRIMQIAVQVAEGLAKAHEAGIIHRDLKPENLMVSPEVVKILDFGLAKVGLGSEEDANAYTIESTQTAPGAIVGTFKYMSPEQASGHVLDFRSDQFSFGTVLYEMATRKHPFQKGTVPQTLTAIIQEEPRAIGSLNPEVPPPFCWVVERCLAKEPEKRYFSTRDLVRDLVAISDRLTDLQPRLTEGRPSNLPRSSALLIGREKELTTAKQLLLRREVRLVTVTGPGGIGKSHFATEVAREITDDFSFGVFFVPLAAVTDPSLVPSVIAQTLGIRESGGHPPVESLKDYLRSCLGGPMLLLIDNFEHLLAAAPLLSELLAIAPGLKILATSRAALRVQDENEFPLPPLALPDPKALPSLETLSQFPAIALFVQRAVAVKPGFLLTDENASAVAEICTRLDGLPLAIQLAAARIKLLSPSAIRSRLASRLRLLTSGARDLPARQQTLRQAIDWSYDLLSDAEQKLFRRLSVFAGGFTLEAAESVCDTNQDLGLDLLDGMASMVDKSLVRQIEQLDEEARFVMLETIREYGLEKLVASGEESPTRRAHAAYCLVLAEEGAAESADGEQKGWLDRFETEHDNFRMALEWLTETHNAEWGLRLGIALFRFWEMREYLAEGRERLGKLLRLEQAATSNSARMRALFAAGVLAADQRDYSASDKLFKESLEIARLLQDKQSMAISLNALAVNIRDKGDLLSATSLFEESLRLWKELGDRLAVARALSNLATVLKSQGNYAQARALYEECLSIFWELGDSTGVAWVLNHQGDVLRDQGDLPTAASLYERSLASFRELNDRWGIAGSLADLGNLVREQGDFASSDALYRESLTLFQDLGHKRGIARLLESFACSAAEQAQPERALKLAGVAAALRQTIGAPLTATEQTKLEQSLSAARQKLTMTGSRTAWLEGWVMPMEIAINDLLRLTSAPGENRTSS
jgi:predicted ATPase/tRNA A-37 threonylcarbamoyl transferase component Bud32